MRRVVSPLKVRITRLNSSTASNAEWPSGTAMTFARGQRQPELPGTHAAFKRRFLPLAPVPQDEFVDVPRKEKADAGVVGLLRRVLIKADRQTRSGLPACRAASLRRRAPAGCGTGRLEADPTHVRRSAGPSASAGPPPCRSPRRGLRRTGRLGRLHRLARPQQTRGTRRSPRTRLARRNRLREWTVQQGSWRSRPDGLSGNACATVRGVRLR